MPEEEGQGGLAEAQRKRLAELQAKQEQEQQIRAAMQAIMDPAAFARLSNVRLSNPDLYERVAAFLLYAARQGQLKGKVTEEQLKLVITKALSQRREPTISFSRK